MHSCVGFLARGNRIVPFSHQGIAFSARQWESQFGLPV